MLDFEKAINIAFLELSKCDRIEEIADLHKYGYEKYSRVWKVVSEIETELNLAVECEFHICFESDFPLSMPWIYLSKSDYERYKYIPHLDAKREICTFVRHGSRINTEKPGDVVAACLRKAKRIMSLGIQGKNEEDYEKEYSAYWDQKYDDNDEVDDKCLSLVNPCTIDSLNLSLLEIISEKTSKYNWVLHQNDNLYSKYKVYLEGMKCKYENHEVFYCDNILNKKPPFNITHKELFKLIESLGGQIYDQLLDYLKRNKKCPIILSSILHGDDRLIKGYKLNEVHSLPKRGAIQSRSLETFLKRTVTRLSFESITPSRIYFRTAGIMDMPKIYKLSIVGLGSIGSNLLYYLNSLPIEKYILVDNESLKIENIGRHFLGFSFVNTLKVYSLKYFIQMKNPLIEVDTHILSIVEIVEKHPEWLNVSDYIFFALGNENVEWWLKEKISESIITKPCFFIWVEPYLCGGHCLYIHPESKDKWCEYFDADGYFRFNVINKTEYEKSNPKLSINEAGCQTYFTPYAAADITKFLCTIFPLITNNMYEECKETTAYTWYGCREILKTEGITISGDAIDAVAGTVRRR